MNDTENTEKTTNSHALKQNMRALKHIHSLNKVLLPLTVLKGIFHSLSPYINLYMSAKIMNELAGDRALSQLIRLVALTIALNLIVSVINSLIGKLHTDATNLYRENSELFLADKTLELSYASLENPDVQQLRREIQTAASMSTGGEFGMYRFGIDRPIDFLAQFTNYAVELILSLGLLSQLFAATIKSGIQAAYIIYSLAIVACMAASIVLKFYFAKLTSDRKMDFTTLHSYGARIDGGLKSYNMGKDIRLYRLDKIILKIKGDYIKFTAKANKEMEYFDYKTEIPEALISRVMQVCAYIFVCMLAVGKLILVGDVIKYVGALERFLGAIKGIFYPIGELKHNTKFLDNHFKFMDIPPEGAKSGTEKVDISDRFTLEFKNVSFRYPASESYALKNVSLKINSGESLAVVGQNGSGKTTLIKLLCGLYEQSEGEILLNGKNINEYDFRQYQNIFSVLFQDFKLFSFSLGENISLRSAYEPKQAEECLEKVGFGERYEKLEKGLETYLYKNFDDSGIEVSGGEAQKIALARVLYKKSPFIVLDEPTSALDPISEYEIYSKFNEITANKTAIFISHRLSSCRFCENIAVFDEGELIQRGSHESLLADEGGKYYQLWNAQAQYYNEKS